MRPWMEKWGSVMLIFFCALVILFSALYTRQDDLRRIAARNAASDQSEQLSDVLSIRYVPPVKSTAARTYKGIYKETGLWQLDPYVYYAVRKGDVIYACCDGDITHAASGTVLLTSGDLTFGLLGDFSLTAKDHVNVSQPLAVMHSSGELRLFLMNKGNYVDPLSYFTP